MALTIDQLNIQITAESAKASAVIDGLIGKFGSLNGTLGVFNSAGGKIKGTFGKVSASANKAAKGVNTYNTSATKANKSTKSFSDTLTRKISKWRTLIGVFNTAAQKMGSWFNESNNYIETLNLFNVTMGEGADAAYAYAESVQKLIGIDIAEWMDYQGTFKQLASGFGVAADSANVMSKNLTQLSYDMASFFNTDVETAFDKLSSAMAGQVKGLREFGIDTTVASLQEYALSKGIDASVRSMTQAEKSLLRYNYIIEKSTITQGDMARTLATPANAIRILKAQLTQLSRAFGNIISVIVVKFIPYVQIMVEALTNAANAIANLMGFELPEIDYSDLGKNMTQSFDDSEDSLDGVSGTLKEIKKQLMGFDELNIISSPDANSAAADGGLGALGDMKPLEYDFLKNLDTSKADAIKQQFVDIGNTINDVAQKIVTAFGFDDVWKDIKTGISSIDFSSIEKSAKSTFSNLKPIASAALKGVVNVFKSYFGYIGKLLGGWISVAGKSIEITMDAIDNFFKAEGKNIATWVSNTEGAITGGFKSASEGIGNIFGSLLEALNNNKSKISTALQETLGVVSGVVMTIGTIYSDLFNGLMTGISNFISEEKPLIDGYLNGMIDSFSLFAESVNTIVGGLFGSVRNWWETDGKAIWAGIVEVFNDITAIMLEFWLDTVKPIIDKISTTLTNLWNKHLKPLWDNVLSFLKSVWDFIKALWDGILKPIVNFIVEFVGPIIVNAFNHVVDVIGTVISVVVDVVSGIVKALGGILDFITGIFTGNWTKAWNGIVKFFTGIWDAIWGVIKGVINLIIDGLNGLWRGLYSALAGIINGVGGIIEGIGEIFGQNWGWKIPSQPPLIPKLASGGIVSEGQMFIAREAGPELVGQIGNKTAVANNDQIVSGIEAGVYRAMMAANTGGNKNVTVNATIEMDGEVVGRKVIKYHNGIVMQTGESPLLV